jgi:hypothetical protein
LQRPCNRLAYTVASGTGPRPGCPSSAARAMLCLFRRQFRLTSERTLPFPVAGSTSVTATFHWELFVIGIKNTKRTTSVRFTTHRRIWGTSTEPHSIRDDCVYRAAPKMNCPTSEACTESGPRSRMRRLVQASYKVGKAKRPRGRRRGGARHISAPRHMRRTSKSLNLRNHGSPATSRHCCGHRFCAPLERYDCGRHANPFRLAGAID